MMMLKCVDIKGRKKKDYNHRSAENIRGVRLMLRVNLNFFPLSLFPLAV